MLLVWARIGILLSIFLGAVGLVQGKTTRDRIISLIYIISVYVPIAVVLWR